MVRDASGNLVISKSHTPSERIVIEWADVPDLVDLALRLRRHQPAPGPLGRTIVVGASRLCRDKVYIALEVRDDASEFVDIDEELYVTREEAKTVIEKLQELLA
jgi:hypothetical protein